MRTDLWIRLRSLFRRKTVENELDAELRFHFDQHVKKLVESGVPIAEARRRARLEFGGLDQVKEECRDARGVRFFETLAQDVRFGFHMLRKSPGFAFVAVLTLALGIGANTAIFSLADQTLLRLLPVNHPEQLVVLQSPGPSGGRTTSDGGGTPFSYPLYKDLRDANPVFSGLLARYPVPVSVTAQAQTGLADGELVSGNYFDVLGVGPALGRVFNGADETAPGANPVAVLSYGYWARQFGSNPGILNTPLTVNGISLTVVGVSRAGFTGVQVGEAPDIFIPVTIKAEMTPNWDGLEDRRDHWLAILGRLKPGFDLRRAQAALQPVYHAILQSDVIITGTRMSAKTRAIYVDKKIILDPGEHGRMILQSDEEMPLAVLWTLAGIILLIATANLAGLLLARSEARQREMGVRLALGAGRARIVRQLLTEGFLITGMGAVAGLTLASAILRILANHLENGLGLRAFDPHLDLGMLVFGVALAIFTGLAFSLPPAIRSSHLNPQASLKGQGANASNRIPRVHFRKVLMTSQIALTTVLLSAAVLFVGTLRNLERVNLGLRTDHVIEFQIDPGLNRYSPAQTVALADRLRDSIAALPGVRSVSAAKLPVLEDWDEGGTIVVEGYVPHPGDHVDVRDNRVGPAYFATMGTPLISGREFTPNDRMGSQKVAVINQKLASLYFAGRNPLGLHIAQDLGNSPRPDIEIVGVVQDSKHSTVRGPVEPYAYFPYAQTPDLGSLAVYVRTNQEPASLAPALRNVVRQADPNLAMFKVRTLVEQVEENTFADRMLSAGSLCIGGLAALLAAIGLYGLMAYVVSRRTHEIGIRRAIGASRASIAWLILREVAWMSGAGLIIGLALAYSTGRLIESRLFGINPSSPFVFAAVAALIAGVVLAAGWLPTRKATRVDPMVALRYE